MDDASLQRKLDDKRRVRERLQDRHRIQTIFARYGSEACRTIWDELRRHQGLGPVLQRLGLPAANSQDEEFEAIQRFLNDQGPGIFLNRLRPHRFQLDWDLFTAQGKGAPETTAPSPGSAKPAHAPDDRGPYTGPERRKGPRDRRSGKDRRGDIESIEKNKRFGRDRRKTRGRRKSDHA